MRPERFACYGKILIGPKSSSERLRSRRRRMLDRAGGFLRHG